MAKFTKKAEIPMNAIERAEAELADAERNLKEMRRNLLNAKEWLKNAEELHSQKQRELNELLKAEIGKQS